ncbi:ribonuclease H-like domain-containing protein [Mycena rebaudengoi]|nr:ribonuclease H-like domain-containing protein [Mycena rebaudengoi]
MWRHLGWSPHPMHPLGARKLSQGTRNSRNQYQNNVILKINARLGGVNFIPEDSDGHKGMAQFRAVPTMVLGADVSHPSSGSTSPSIAALVSSWDTGACRYIASVRVQRSRMEIIEDLETMVIRAIKIFTKYNKMVPAIQNAVLKFLHLYGHHRPAITFIICGKKHHIRFFPDCGDAEPRNKNFPAGFVGDRDIGHPVFTDFYLQSQKGLQGTSRPCHYTVAKK